VIEDCFASARLAMTDLAPVWLAMTGFIMIWLVGYFVIARRA